MFTKNLETTKTDNGAVGLLETEVLFTRAAVKSHLYSELLTTEIEWFSAFLLNID